MTEKTKQSAGVTVLTVRQIFSLLLKRAWLLILAAILFGGASYYISSNWITPQYESTVAFYVNNNALSTDNRISSSDLWVSQNLVDTYMVILDTGETLRAVIREAGVELTQEQLQHMIRAKMVEETELFTVTVTGQDPETTYLLAQTIGKVLPERIGTIMSGTSAKVADDAQMPERPSEPSPVRDTVSGALFGVVFCASILLLQTLLTVRIRKEGDISRVTDLPILAKVPLMTPKRKSKAVPQGATIATSMSEGAAEGMQLLSLKLPFCFADEDGCHVLGVSSAMAGEGKSTSAVNLAYSLAKLKNRVLLMDCDLRRPSVHVKLDMEQKPGLSEYLVRRNEVAAVRTCTFRDARFWVTTSGWIPPNPLELLSSDRMGQLLKNLRQYYDYIILDLPPVGEVGDAMVTAKLTDGTMLVVRQKHCTRPALQAAIREFESVEERLVGIVYNCVK